MDKPWHEPLPEQEMERFRQLKDIQVVFDVGARTSLDYLEVFPNAEYHLFEPWPPFYEWLKEACKDKPNVHVNGWGIGDTETSASYDNVLQSFHGGESGARKTPTEFPIKTLDSYIDEHNIQRMDFLKIDTEGYDFKVLKGGPKAVALARYIQYEHWDNLQEFHDLLEKDFDMEYIGLRNVLCTKK